MSTTYDDATEALLSRLAAIGTAAEDDGWLELPPKVAGSLAMARDGWLLNVCFDLGIFENMVYATIIDNERKVRDFGPRYRPIAPAKVRRLRAWHVEAQEIRRALTAIVQRQSNAAAQAKRETDAKARGGRSW